MKKAYKIIALVSEETPKLGDLALFNDRYWIVKEINPKLETPLSQEDREMATVTFDIAPESIPEQSIKETAKEYAHQYDVGLYYDAVNNFIAGATHQAYIDDKQFQALAKIAEDRKDMLEQSIAQTDSLIEKIAKITEHKEQYKTYINQKRR